MWWLKTPQESFPELCQWHAGVREVHLIAGWVVWEADSGRRWICRSVIRQYSGEAEGRKQDRVETATGLQSSYIKVWVDLTGTLKPGCPFRDFPDQSKGSRPLYPCSSYWPIFRCGLPLEGAALFSRSNAQEGLTTKVCFLAAFPGVRGLYPSVLKGVLRGTAQGSKHTSAKT